MDSLGVYAEAGGLVEACIIAAIVALAVYNALLSLTLREPAHYAYVVYAAASAAVYATHFTFADLSWPESSPTRWLVNHLASGVALSAALRFTRDFLGVQSYAPRLARGLDVAAATLLGGTLLLLLTAAPPVREAVIGVAGGLSIGMTLLVSLDAVRRRRPSAWFFAVAWTPLLLAAMAYSPVAIGVVGAPFISGRALASAHALEMLLLALALAYRLRLATERGLQQQQARIGELRLELAGKGDAGSYRLGPLLGQGGMGRVHRATHTVLGREAAVKLLTPSRTDERQAFETEARVTSLLDHPNIVRVYECGYLDHGVFFYAMELLEGASLRDAVRGGGPMPPSRVVWVLSQAAAALAEAHRQGVIHRDVKPSNILLCRGSGRHDDRVKLVDFGVALPVRGRWDRRRTLGTPRYMAPESVEGTAPELTPAVDIFGLGAVGHFLLTGEHAYESQSFLSILNREAAPSVLAHRPGACSPQLDALLRRMMSRQPGMRPDAEGVRAALASVPEGGAWTGTRERACWESFVPVPASLHPSATAASTQSDGLVA